MSFTSIGSYVNLLIQPTFLNLNKDLNVILHLKFDVKAYYIKYIKKHMHVFYNFLNDKKINKFLKIIFL
jgi:hypothetical protein